MLRKVYYCLLNIGSGRTETEGNPLINCSGLIEDGTVDTQYIQPVIVNFSVYLWVNKDEISGNFNKKYFGEL